ncbi:calcineurin-like phosphoesterase [Raphidocelis subcapitata]|uniref:Calcineurin-like phosphoesterase n=1 Tax=Raphidocelis subcapitata TaxID=307507 RepID=A0A2V0NSH6_9CHLO|nr:calcineurin-like phosphoesterase [Raphidocelis subcapitata]|eukprot:GBF87795.1 calcineurin-like phosphoesterase [Raphidocelis subcapitata]
MPLCRSVAAAANSRAARQLVFAGAARRRSGMGAAAASAALELRGAAARPGSVKAAGARAGVDAAAAAEVPQGCRPGFSCGAAGGGAEAVWPVSIMGDLHLEPAQMHLFAEAQGHLRAAMADGEGRLLPGARVVQVGDLGGYKHGPGTRGCFEVALDYLSGFGAPFSLITGNHDLEGHEFETDEENLEAWRDVFGQRHYWAAEVGPVLLVGLSTVRFRSNAFSVHEVYVDDEQVAWFEALLAAHPGRPVAVLTHAPPAGSGLKVVQGVHVKNRCAWLNHSDRPGRFIELVERHPNVRLWFSGHFHLAQNYPDSITAVGRCAFVQVGVIGDCNRDGFRQSRLLRVTQSGYQVLTVDHGAGGRTRVDLEQDWDDDSTPSPVTPEDELVCDSSVGWLCSNLDCGLSSPIDASPDAAPATRWFAAGPNCLLAHHEGGLLVEYDCATRAPIGLVADATGKHVSLVAAGDAPPARDDGSDAVAVLLRDPSTGETSRIGRNERGTFFRVFQPNKWEAKRREAQERAAAAAAGGAAKSEAAVAVQ